MTTQHPPVGVKLATDVEFLPDRPTPYRARVRWTNQVTKKRESVSRSWETIDQAEDWISVMQRAASSGVDPAAATMTLADYGNANLELALRGLEDGTRYPYLAGWRKRVVPTLGHLEVPVVKSGIVDRAVHAWIADDCSRSTVKNTIGVLVRVMEQAVRDGLVDRNPARIVGWQREYARAEDELDDPRSLALPDWETLNRLAAALVEASADVYGRNAYAGWADVVVFAACTAARIGEVSGCRVKDIDTTKWKWTVQRQTTTSLRGLVDKGTKGKRARTVPIIEEIRELIRRRIDATDGRPDARLFTGPRGGRISTAVLRDATHWDDVVTKLGYSHLRRHDLRHTGLTWMADAGIPIHRLQKIAGHGQITTTQRYLHPDEKSILDGGRLLSAHLRRSVDQQGT